MYLLILLWIQPTHTRSHKPLLLLLIPGGVHVYLTFKRVQDKDEDLKDLGTQMVYLRTGSPWSTTAETLSPGIDLRERMRRVTRMKR